MLLSNLMLESRQVRHFSQWDLQSLDPVDPLASVSNLYISLLIVAAHCLEQICCSI